MRLISLDELIFGELIEFQMQAGPLFARIRSRAYTYIKVSKQWKKDKPSRAVRGFGRNDKSRCGPRWFAALNDYWMYIYRRSVLYTNVKCNLFHMYHSYIGYKFSRMCIQNQNTYMNMLNQILRKKGRLMNSNISWIKRSTQSNNYDFVNLICQKCE